jgi:hypothetical protein
MTSRDDIDMQNMALAAELARQLCHDFNNFIYNLFLQIEIDASTPAHGDGAAWDGVKAEAKHIMRRMEEWNRFQSRFSFTEAPIDVHAAIRQVAAERARDGHTIQLSAAIADGPLLAVGAMLDIRHLLHLLIEEVQEKWEGADVAPRIAIDTSADGPIAVVKISAAARAGRPVSNETMSLVASACRSLAVRLGATIEREMQPPTTYAVRVELPMRS